MRLRAAGARLGRRRGGGFGLARGLRVRGALRLGVRLPPGRRRGRLRLAGHQRRPRVSVVAAELRQPLRQRQRRAALLVRCRDLRPPLEQLLHRARHGLAGRAVARQHAALHGVLEEDVQRGVLHGVGRVGIRAQAQRQGHGVGQVRRCRARGLRQHQAPVVPLVSLRAARELKAADVEQLGAQRLGAVEAGAAQERQELRGRLRRRGVAGAPERQAAEGLARGGDDVLGRAPALQQALGHCDDAVDVTGARERGGALHEQVQGLLLHAASLRDLARARALGEEQLGDLCVAALAGQVQGGGTQVLLLAHGEVHIHGLVPEQLCQAREAAGGRRRVQRRAAGLVPQLRICLELQQHGQQRLLVRCCRQVKHRPPLRVLGVQQALPRGLHVVLVLVLPAPRAARAVEQQLGDLRRRGEATARGGVERRLAR
mmetsp:Transcript_99582/g.257330  ORF Transcript_99582/g.257330 Transcript_99582/m.257330 type:complete len:430 (+) Transcript_99582:419-1708(+)